MTEQTQDKYILRLPDGMRAEIKAAAERNKRSMNAELLARLASAMDPDALALLDQFAMRVLPTVVGLQGMPVGEPDELWNEAIAKQTYALAAALLEERTEYEGLRK